MESVNCWNGGAISQHNMYSVPAAYPWRFGVFVIQKETLAYLEFL